MWDEFELVPLYEAVVSAGPGAAMAGERVLAQMAFRKYWLEKVGLDAKQLAMVRARGDSMTPTINDGDTLLLDLSRQTPESGRIFVIRINAELRAKRLQVLVDGAVRISSDNRAYADEILDAPDIHQLHVLGQVVWRGSLI